MKFKILKKKRKKNSYNRCCLFIIFRVVVEHGQPLTNTALYRCIEFVNSRGYQENQQQSASTCLHLIAHASPPPPRFFVFIFSRDEKKAIPRPKAEFHDSLLSVSHSARAESFLFKWNAKHLPIFPSFPFCPRSFWNAQYSRPRFQKGGRGRGKGTHVKKRSFSFAQGKPPSLLPPPSPLS